MKNKLLPRFRFLLFFMCASLFLAALYYAFFVRRITVVYTPASLVASTEPLDTPYCGFYQMSGFTPDDLGAVDDAALWSSQQCDSDPYPLMLLEINLKNYAEQSLSQNALDQVDAILSSCAFRKKQLILRFLYDWDGNALQTEPSSVSRIEEHIQQLAPVLNAHSDCVYLLQGIFTGNNGEMHDTNYASPAIQRQLMQKLADLTDPSIYLSVRTPAQLRSILQNKNTLRSNMAYNGSLASRLGLFNDGMLGSDSDLGTYDDTPLSDPSNFEEKGTRKEELRFQDALCQYVPNGGEVVLDNSYNDLTSAIQSLSVMHVSYLNAAYDQSVLEKWKRTTYVSSDAFSGCSGYDYIRTHLGYRYRMDASSVHFHTFADDTATLYLTVANDGFAPAYRQFDTILSVTEQTSGLTFQIPLEIDNRQIASADTAVFPVSLNVRQWEAGTYSLTLTMTDPTTGQSIPFANSGYETRTEVPIGSISVN
ncbi:DUF4832 domain-containing protein [uncultured Eubacterium sp.]|uniref:DUF4832 domain-containing protein n=1 Tax=uncultured Eubacterium sp. TaxID=165185 RepID=UPI0025927AD8|nr:DUF4832 domain-containing protein [uncultured Eubacterium sp.]